MKVEPLQTINRDFLDPPYVQLANILRNQVAEGFFPPGGRLPSESELCKRYHVSHMTVRRTIKLLSDQGVVETFQGRGTFVKGMRLKSGTFKLRELDDLFRDDGRTKVKLLEVRVAKADENIVRKLRLRKGDRTIFIKRLLVQDDDPVLYHEEYLIGDPAQPVIESEMEVTSLHGLFAGNGASNLKRGELTIEAVELEKDEAALLKVGDGLAAFCIEHLFFDFEERPVSWGRFICRKDRLKFKTIVGIEKSKPLSGPESVAR